MSDIKLLGHSGIKITGESNIYVDPYKVENPISDADYIFITHSHYDHYSPEDIIKLIKEDTVIIVPKDLVGEVTKLGFKNIVEVVPNLEYKLNDISFLTVNSYNISKAFHPKENNWVGYIINTNNKKYYIAGDTDFVDEIRKVKCDVAFVPVGGTYTMDYKDAANLVNEIKPKLTIPIHYGSIVGTNEDATEFKKLINEDIKCEIMM